MPFSRTSRDKHVMQKETTEPQCYPETTHHHVTSNLSLLYHHHHRPFVPHCVFNFPPFPVVRLEFSFLGNSATAAAICCHLRPQSLKNGLPTAWCTGAAKKFSQNLCRPEVTRCTRTPPSVSPSTPRTVPKPNEKKSFNNSKAHHRIRGIIINCTHLNMV